MPLLLDFSPEVISTILDHLIPDSPSLDALCLAGNHALLELTRPYTWREVNMVLGAEGGASKRTAERLTAFLADPSKTGAIRSLNITLVGPYISEMPAIRVLLENLKAFVNVTHASFNCMRSRNVFLWGTPGRLVRDAVEWMPSLVSVTVIGCNANEPSELEFAEEDSEDGVPPPPPPPKLVHVATRFCNPVLSDIWWSCPNIRVVEMEGGHPEEFWRRTVATDVVKGTTEDSTKEEIAIAESLVKFRGYGGPDTGISQLCPADNFDFVERITLKCDAAKHQSPSDPYHLNRHFKTYIGDPHPHLKELAVDFSFMLVSQYRTLLCGSRGPVIERLGVVLSNKEYWDGQEFETLIKDLKNDDSIHGGLPFFASFESLAEFCAPCNGVTPAWMDLLVELLSHAPVLKNLYFDPADDADLLPAAAQKYADSVGTLQAISWKDQATFEVERNVGSDPVEIVRKPYAAPTWMEFRGIGNWWDM